MTIKSMFIISGGILLITFGLMIMADGFIERNVITVIFGVVVSVISTLLLGAEMKKYES